MIKILQLATLFLFVSLGSLAYGQDIPAVTTVSNYQGLGLPDIPGNLTFSLNLTESARSGYYSSGGEVYVTSISGNTNYLSNSTIHPFRLGFAGGYSFTTAAQQSSPFLNLTLSQTLASRNWTVILNDTTRFVPESPSGGLSGLTGLCDLCTPTPTTGGQGILTSYSRRIINTASADVDRKLTGSTDITATGSSSVQRFFGSTVVGNDYNQVAAQVGVKHRLDALSSFTLSYDFTRFSYISVNFSFISQGGSVQYIKQWTRRFSTDLSAGPQVHTSSNPAAVGGSSLTYSANLNATYTLQKGSLNASYIRGVQGGSGVVQGSSSDTLRGALTRRIGEYSNITFDSTYSKHHQLFTANSFNANTFTAGVQASHTISQNFSVYGSYVAQHQSTRGTIASGSFSGLSQSVAVGLTYSPRPIHLGH